MAWVLMSSSLCSTMRTPSPAESELAEPEKVRLEIPSINWDKAGADCWIDSPLRIHVEGCWQTSRSVWK
jgi:hypothetical protein